MPYATAFCAMVAEAVWMRRGVEIAHWLFWQRKITGASAPREFIASWTAPSERRALPEEPDRDGPVALPLAGPRDPRRVAGLAADRDRHRERPRPFGTTLPSSNPIV